MLRVAIVVLLAARIAVAEEWAEFTKRFQREMQAEDAAARKIAVEGIAAFDTPEAVALAAKVWHAQMKRLASLEAEKWKIRDEMAKYPLEIRDFKPVNKDWWEKRKALDLEARKVEERMEAERAVAWAAVGVIVSRTTELAVAEAIDLFAKSPDDALRAAIARTAETGSEEWVAALIEGAGADKDPLVRASALGALVARKAAPALPAFVKALFDPVWQVKLGGIRGLDVLDLVEGIPPLIEALARLDGRLKWEANSALVRLTGEDFHGDAGLWKSWWEANHEAWVLVRPPRAEREAKAKEAPGGTTFYGIIVKSKRVLFVLDRSESMKGPARWKPTVESGKANAFPIKPGDRKIDVAKLELCRAILGLPEDALFNVVFYNRDLTVFQPKGLTKASRENKDAAIRFLAPIEPEGVTNTFDTLEKCLDWFGKEGGDKNFTERADTFFLLSDGFPSAGQIIDPDRIREEIRRRNLDRHVVLHTVAVGEDAADAFLKGLAEDNGGQFVKR